MPGFCQGQPYPWLRSASREMWTPGDENEKEEKKDLEYWKQLYPAEVRRVQREVEHQCDLLDYSGSVIYDEYPDRIALARICEAVYQALMQENARDAMGGYPSGMPDAPAGRGTQESAGEDADGEEETESAEEAEDFIVPEEEPDDAGEMPAPLRMPSQSSMQMETMQYRGDGRFLQDMIEVLLYNEIHRRRIRRRRGHSWYFG